MLTLDGSEGEGGGQMLRTALSLSLITQTPFRMTNVRAKRSKKGLLRQHLTALKAAMEIANADAVGAHLGSTEIEFFPQTVRHGNYRFAVGSAGSASLVCTTVLFPLLCVEGFSDVVFEGGTANPAAPPVAYLNQTFLPMLMRMNAQVVLREIRNGFFPAGGGAFSARIMGQPKWQRLDLLARGTIHDVRAVGVVSALPENIAQREVDTVQKILGAHVRRIAATVDSAGTGNVLYLHVQSDALTETFTAFGERGVSAENVARTVCAEAQRYLSVDVPVGEHLADQLLVPMALAGGGEFRTLLPTQHTRTQADVMQMFLGTRVHFREQGHDVWHVEVRT